MCIRLLTDCGYSFEQVRNMLSDYPFDNTIFDAGREVYADFDITLAYSESIESEYLALLKQQSNALVHHLYDHIQHWMDDIYEEYDQVMGPFSQGGYYPSDDAKSPDFPMPFSIDTYFTIAAPSDEFEVGFGFLRADLASGFLTFPSNPDDIMSVLIKYKLMGVIHSRFPEALQFALMVSVVELIADHFVQLVV